MITWVFHHNLHGIFEIGNLYETLAELFPSLAGFFSVVLTRGAIEDQWVYISGGNAGVPPWVGCRLVPAYPVERWLRSRLLDHSCFIWRFVPTNPHARWLNAPHKSTSGRQMGERNNTLNLKLTAPPMKIDFSFGFWPISGVLTVSFSVFFHDPPHKMGLSWIYGLEISFRSEVPWIRFNDWGHL